MSARPEPPPDVFVVDDDPAIRTLVTTWLRHAGYEVRAFENGAAALRALEHSQPCAICLDVMMPVMSGVEVLRRVKERTPDMPVLMLTARDVVETAVQCIRIGALDYLLKPLDRKRLLKHLEWAAGRVPPVASSAGLPGIVGGSAAMERVCSQVARVAASDISVHIFGESGTGKELVARAIHQLSPRACGPFMALNCGAIPESLQDSELYGHEKGAFTGAIATRPGRFEQANGGVIFLDEVAELHPASQVRLLRVLQDNTLERVGGNHSVELDLRVLSATHTNLRTLADQGAFREDLFYRLVVFPIELPPLRERTEDIPPLAFHFIEKYAADTAGRITSISADALHHLQSHSWPGNVRELENMVHRAMVRSNGAVLEVCDFPANLCRLITQPTVTPISPMPPNSSVTPAKPAVSMEEIEKGAVLSCLEACGGNITQAARKLGIGRATFYRKLARYGVVRK